MTKTRQQIGVLDFETEYRLRDREIVTDPFVGLEWHLLRAGHPPYTEAIRKRIYQSPRMRQFIKSQDQKGTLKTYKNMTAGKPKPAGAGPQASPADGNGDQAAIGWTDDELEALASKSAEAESLVAQMMEGGLSGADLIAEHLVEDVRRRGEPLKELWLRCDDGHGWQAGGSCPECHKKVTSEEWKPVVYSPALAHKIWSSTDAVSESLLRTVFGENVYRVGDDPKSGLIQLGSALLTWVVTETERIQDGLTAIGEDLEKN